MDEYFSNTSTKVIYIILSLIIFILSVISISFRNKKDDKNSSDFGFAISIIGILLSIQCTAFIGYLFF